MLKGCSPLVCGMAGGWNSRHQSETITWAYHANTTGKTSLKHFQTTNQVHEERIGKKSRRRAGCSVPVETVFSSAWCNMGEVKNRWAGYGNHWLQNGTSTDTPSRRNTFGFQFFNSCNLSFFSQFLVFARVWLLQWITNIIHHFLDILDQFLSKIIRPPKTRDSWGETPPLCLCLAGRRFPLPVSTCQLGTFQRSSLSPYQLVSENAKTKSSVHLIFPARNKMFFICFYITRSVYGIMIDMTSFVMFCSSAILSTYTSCCGQRLSTCQVAIW